MDKIALNVPGFKNIPETGLQVGPGYGVEQASLGGVLSGFLGLVFYFALFLSFFWFVWGAYEYMVAQGHKEALAAARDRIRWSIIGFAMLIAAFLIGNYAPTIFPFIRTFYLIEQVPQIQDPASGATQPLNQPTQQNCQPGSGQPC